MPLTATHEEIKAYQEQVEKYEQLGLDHTK